MIWNRKKRKSYLYGTQDQAKPWATKLLQPIWDCLGVLYLLPAWISGASWSRTLRRKTKSTSGVCGHPFMFLMNISSCVNMSIFGDQLIFPLRVASTWRTKSPKTTSNKRKSDFMAPKIWYNGLWQLCLFCYKKVPVKLILNLCFFKLMAWWVVHKFALWWTENHEDLIHWIVVVVLIGKLLSIQEHIRNLFLNLD